MTEHKTTLYDAVQFLANNYQLKTIVLHDEYSISQPDMMQRLRRFEQDYDSLSLGIALIGESKVIVGFNYTDVFAALNAIGAINELFMSVFFHVSGFHTHAKIDDIPKNAIVYNFDNHSLHLYTARCKM